MKKKCFSFLSLQWKSMGSHVVLKCCRLINDDKNYRFKVTELSFIKSINITLAQLQTVAFRSICLRHAQLSPATNGLLRSQIANETEGVCHFPLLKLANWQTDLNARQWRNWMHWEEDRSREWRQRVGIKPLPYEPLHTAHQSGKELELWVSTSMQIWP